jgi:hypothetical protein
MKVAIWILLVIMTATPALAELTPQDLEAIRQIVQEEVKAEIIESEKRTDLKFKAVNTRIDGMEKSLGTRIDGVEKSLGTRTDGVEKSLGTRIDGLDKRVSDLRSILIALIAVIVIPTGVLTYAIAQLTKTYNAISELNRRSEELSESLKDVITQGKVVNNEFKASS